MNKIKSFNVAYDAETDVLYISQRNDNAVRGVEDQSGIVWRYASDGKLIGAIIMDFLEIWGHNQSQLASRLSKNFHIPANHAANVIESAMDHRRH
jgi:uncharacterized protein YuzE